MENPHRHAAFLTERSAGRALRLARNADSNLIIWLTAVVVGISLAVLLRLHTWASAQECWAIEAPPSAHVAGAATGCGRMLMVPSALHHVAPPPSTRATMHGGRPPLWVSLDPGQFASDTASDTDFHA
jgi:hypothetical protein